MFKPGSNVVKCPVCGAELTRESIDQFDVPVGYSLTCDHCLRYSDIWVNGLRELQCGEWFSEDFESNYGRKTWKERQVLLQFQVRLLWEKLKYRLGGPPWWSNG